MITNFIIRTYVDGIKDTIFIDNDNPIEVGQYTYNAQRMGAVPSISATIKSFICLDSHWNKRQYIVCNGEKYFVFNTPTSSKKNTDGRYEYSVTFRSERYELNGLYFFDVVGEDSSYAGGYISNSTQFSFFGDIKEYAERLQATLDYNKVDYTVVIDDGIDSDPVSVEFDNIYILAALQESFNLYNIPHYFKGREIHFGYANNDISEVFEYGNSLLEITKTNANYKQVTFCSGIGSENNLPYYYPNLADYNALKLQKEQETEIDFRETFNNLGIGIDYDDAKADEWLLLTNTSTNNVFDIYVDSKNSYEIKVLDSLESQKSIEIYSPQLNIVANSLNNQIPTKIEVFIDVEYYSTTERVILNKSQKIYSSNISNTTYPAKMTNVGIDDSLVQKVVYRLVVTRSSGYASPYIGTVTALSSQIQYLKEYEPTPYIYNILTVDAFIQSVIARTNITSQQRIYLQSLLVRVQANIKIIETDYKVMPYMQNLIPKIFRDTNGDERFYPSKNDTYLIPNTSGKAEYYYFENEYDGTIIKEQVIQSFEDIQPTIEGILNTKGQIIATITDFAYDTDDNDDFALDEDGNVTDTFQHPYFYMKLKIFDGSDGFNLFASSIDSGEMTINMRNGNLAGTSHIIQSIKEEVIGKFIFHNPVQVDSNGDIVAGNWQDKINTNISSAQPQQQDTRKNEIWIAVTKDIDTFGVLMPNVSNNYKPTKGDEFNITNIYLPQGYITAAEKRLEDAIIKYMWENNSEKFNFTIKFSRVFLADNPNILAQLNENASISIKYDSKTITSYISAYSYKSPTETECLPEITVTLNDTITIQQGSLQNNLTAVKKEIERTSITNNDILKYGQDYFIRKDIENTANAPIRFSKGVFSANYKEGDFAGSGWGAYSKEDGTSVGVFDELIIRKTATFNELVINQISFTLGQTVFTNGGFEIENVEEYNEYFRCYYDNENGLRMAGVVVGDFVRCQEYDNSYSSVTRYYSRCVISIGSNYVDLSRSEFSGIDTPKIGDNCVQWGNKNDINRQFAIIRNVTGGAYDQFLWGINSVSSVGEEYYFVGVRGAESPRLQFGNETIGGIRGILGIDDEGNPDVTLDIWANELNVVDLDGNYVDVYQKVLDVDNLASAALPADKFGEALTADNNFTTVQNTTNNTSNKVDNLSNASTNRLRWTEFTQGETIRMPHLNYFPSYQTLSVDANGVLVVSKQTESQQFRLHLTNVTLRGGVDYIFSFEQYGFTDALDEILWRGTLTELQLIKSQDVSIGSVKGKRHIYSIKIDNTENAYLHLSTFGVSEQLFTNIGFYNFMLAEGNTVSAWSASPLDVEDNLIAVKNVADAALPTKAFDSTLTANSNFTTVQNTANTANTTANTAVTKANEAQTLASAALPESSFNTFMGGATSLNVGIEANDYIKEITSGGFFEVNESNVANYLDSSGRINAFKLPSKVALNCNARTVYMPIGDINNFNELKIELYSVNAAKICTARTDDYEKFSDKPLGQSSVVNYTSFNIPYNYVVTFEIVGGTINMSCVEPKIYYIRTPRVCE